MREARIRAATLVLVAAGLSCRRPGGPAPAPLASAKETTDATAPASPDASAHAIGWAEAVRRERWTEARKLLERLPDSEKSKPEVMYVRARVALASGEAKAALPLLEGLEPALPLLAPDIARFRAEAQIAAGPFAEAGEYFAARGTPSAWLRAADAFERAKDLSRARALCNRVIAADKRSRKEEAAARACHVRLADSDDRSAAADARWVAVHAPDVPEAKACDAELAKLDPAHPLSGEELMTRARVLADAGRTDDALHALDRVAAAPDPKVKRIDALRLRGDILYRTHGRALEAATVLEECAQNGGPHAEEDAFHAARALSRADHDDDAIFRMTRLSHAHPSSTWGDEATFFVPYLRLLHGQWREAAAGFDDYAKRYPNGVERSDALRNRALAHLMIQDWREARRLFEELAAQEPDAVASARAWTLAALATLRDGDRTHALARWTDVARSNPLSWPALVARARLVQQGVTLPPAIEPADGASDAAPLTVDLPAPVDMLHRVGLDTDAESALRDREGVVSSRAPAGRGLEALCNAYGLLGRARRRYQLAQQVPAALLARAPTPRSRWAWECVYASPYLEEVAEREASEPVPATLAYSVMRLESDFDPDAVSPAHAFGLMQLVPETASAIASGMHLAFDEDDLLHPMTSILLGMRHLHDLLEHFHGQGAIAVAAYNAGIEPLARWLSRAPDMELDAFVERIPYPETRAYVVRVMGNFAHYEYLWHGEAGVPLVALALTP